MASVGPSQSEKLSNLILKWYETQKSQSNNINEGPEIDVINITWILKALGFNLDFMDFLPGSISGDKPKEINIEVKCSVSGLVARLNYKLEGCACPKKKDEQTFWEVQAMAPSSKTQVKQKDTSCSLLPEMSPKCSLVSKAILNNLLKYYKDCVEEKGKEQPSEAIKKIKIPEMFASNQVKSDDVPALKNTEMATQEIAIPEITVIAEPKSQVLTRENNKSLSDSFMESINTDQVNIATSSPNDIFDEQTNRDANVVQALNEARSKINQALLYMRLNVTQDLSMASSTNLMTTPKGVPPKRVPQVGTPGSLKRSATATDITQHKASAQKEKQKNSVSRRSSFGLKPMVTAASMVGASSIKRCNSMRGDTPRPRIQQKPTGIPSKSSSNMSSSNLSSISTSSSSISSVTDKFSTKEPFLKPLPGSKKKIIPKAPSLIERFKMQNPVTPKK